MPIGTRFTENVEIGAIRIHGQDSLEVVTTDGGKEVRNLRAEDEPRRYQVSLPVADIEGDDTADYDSVRQMWADSGRGLEPFYFYDFVDDEDVLVRFESEMQITAPAGHLRHIDTFTLKECLGE
jgi:hypothetical protein